ncbi:hypothetical protein SISNIDRAFT_455676 [Sistotremastrum niveocremeum HHB9708]|uniref:MYND-type domain-containing protein n=1 Tax=Sistotremastrum niveocremeum HHB9708 TaxID=1314777 RepID=A0A164TLN9_9AGAM|nr:hypothetical protein SISNIDRAFT_455676 [Sistotremastrum niveocremeum HHB9708]
MPSKKQNKLLSKSAMHGTVFDISSMSAEAVQDSYNSNMGAIEISNRATQASMSGDYRTAAALHRQALALKLKTFPETSVQAAISFNGLGESLLSLQDLSGAEEALSKALRVRDDKTFGGLGEGPRFDAAVTRENMAQLREAQGRFEEAKEMRMRGKSKGHIACGNDKCPGQLFLLSALKSCSVCSCVFYCSPDCQKKDWARHKGPCKKEKERRKEKEAQDAKAKLESEAPTTAER